MADAIRSLVGRAQIALEGLRDREEGQGLVEYVVVIALVALLIFAALLFFTDILGDVYSQIANILDDNVPN